MRTQTQTSLLASLLLAGVAVALLAGCSSTETVGCDFFANDNCWTQTTAEAYKCLDSTDGTPRGMYDGTRTECSFPDGTSIKFATPVPESTLDYEFDFEVLSAAGDTCAGFKEFEGGLEIQTSLGTFRQDLAGLDVVISCPDGGEFEIGAFDALECDLGTLPGFATAGSGGSISMSLLGAGGQWFSCADVVLDL